ncbi:DUF1738 domain-containing protein [Methylobacterium sp. WL64]|uniref:ArdC family protein n=1 Tax=Methylobacterium sp. WL64 TaxID=2603894 RepID=UPI0011C71969|nr:zincin-like metallopeptidase domain-containing protein [Methylobacterium sp. WL64]TXM96395.1 DUF1738 domain-containing protein [Methylobacterium sp. WL64]
MKADLYTKVTDQIVASLEAGVKPWHKPWSSGQTISGPIRLPLRGNGVPYRGINILMLWGAATDNGYASATWMTFKQAIELGACVRKGEKGTTVVYAGAINRTGTDEATGEDTEQRIPFLKGYSVFNVEQIDGLPDSYRTPAPALPAGIERIERAEAFAAATGATIRHGGNRAFYVPGADMVQMPPLQAFRDAESYYATLTHELTHWTGHERRLARTFGKRFADQAYAFEELVAELGAAFVMAGLDLTPEPRADHADYLAHWLGILKADKRAIFTAASHAQRAADFLTGQTADAVREAA